MGGLFGAGAAPALAMEAAAAMEAGEAVAMDYGPKRTGETCWLFIQDVSRAGAAAAERGRMHF